MHPKLQISALRVLLDDKVDVLTFVSMTDLVVNSVEVARSHQVIKPLVKLIKREVAVELAQA